MTGTHVVEGCPELEDWQPRGWQKSREMLRVPGGRARREGEKEKEMAKRKRKRMSSKFSFLTFTNFLLPVSMKATSHD